LIYLNYGGKIIMDVVYRSSEGTVCDILSILECCECDEVEVALIDRKKKAKKKFTHELFHI
jgi:hypothetical protein